MKAMSLYSAVGLFAAAQFVASNVMAATVTNLGTSFTPDADDISNLIGAASDAENISAGDDEATYIALNRTSKIQSFTTGSNPTGYTMDGFVLQHVTYPTVFSVDNGDNFKFRIGTISGNTLTPSGVATTTTGVFSGGPLAAGSFVDFVFDTTPTLLPGTTYFFEVSADGNGDPYFELNGTPTDAYAGGSAFRGDNAGNFDSDNTATSLTGDRVFVARLTATPIPEPVSLSLLGLGGLGLLARRRKA